jgi:hypothetical protein
MGQNDLFCLKMENQTMLSIRKYYETFTLSLITKIGQQTQAVDLFFLTVLDLTQFVGKKLLFVSRANTFHMVCTDVYV